MYKRQVLSGLQSIDASYYEAAAVDGASYWQKMFQITIPLVRPNLTISTIPVSYTHLDVYKRQVYYN